MKFIFGLSRRRPSLARFKCVFLAMILMAAMGSAQWNTQSPIPTNLDIRGIAAPTSQRVFIATDDNSFDNSGALFESTNGGTSWVQRDIPADLSSPLYGISFYNTNLGWTFGNVNYRTTDGGTTWVELPPLGSAYFMKFYSPNFGLATGNFSQYISRNGGLAWEPSPHNIFAFDFVSEQIGIGAADSGMFRTTNGGSTFTLVQVGNVQTVAFLSSTVAVGIVDSNFVRSTDAGATWAAGTSSGGRNHLVAVSAAIALAWGRTGTFPDYDDRIFRSSDGGQTWTDLGEVMPMGVHSFAVADQQTVIASDFAGNMFRSTNAGQTWSQTFRSRGTQPGFLSSAAPVFTNAQTGFFGYGSGFIVKTTDGGATWLQISSGTGKSLNDISRFANGNLIAIGENGTLLTGTGSSPWVLHEPFTERNLVAVHVVGPQSVVVADDDGRIYTSSNGGTNWVSGSTVPPSLQAEDVHFADLVNGWVIGFGSVGNALFRTTNGGETWTSVPDFGGAYVAVDFEGGRGWAANVGGRFYRSSNGGTSWIEGDLPGSTTSISDMDFFDANIGYAVGGFGYAARSIDGGVTWNVLPTPNSTDVFTDISLLGPNELWLSTAAGKAYYSASGGQNWAVIDNASPGFSSFRAIAASSSGSAWTVGGQGRIEYFAGPPPPPLNRPPDAAFRFIASRLTANFTDLSSDPDGIIVRWAWDFGDSTSSMVRHPSHTFARTGTFIVRLTVTDDDGDSSTAVRFVTVQPGPGGTFGDFTEVTPFDSLFVTNQDEDFWVITTAPADYDGDGDLDIAVLGYYVVYNQSVEDRLLLLRNDGSGGQTEWNFTYTQVPLGTLTSGSSDLAWGDVDGDGDQDLALGTDGVTVLYRNDAGTLVLTNSELPAYWEDNDQADFDLRSISWADYDNDGDLDILLPSAVDTTASAYRTMLMRNDGSNGTGGWTFTADDSVLAPTAHAQTAWADYDHDQDLDLLLVNIAPLTDNGFIRRYRNDGNGAFVGQDILGTLTVEHGEVQWGDYDADGDLDILVAGHIKELNGNFAQALRIYRNNNETYDSLNVISCIPCEGWFDITAASWADYDSDGDMDILLAGTYNSGSNIEGRARVYTNTGGVFTDSGNELPAPRASGTRGGTFSWLDIDGEGDLDYFIAGQYFVPGGNGLVEAQMHVYRNDAPGRNSAPSVPSGLNASVQTGGTVLLSWVSATDDHTPSAALTYDLDLFRNGVSVSTPRRLPEPGKVSAVTEWLLTGLADGFYTWKLRAVDASYSGGPIASGNFHLGITGLGSEDRVPYTYAFEKNYPNPFNPTTTFRFALPEQAHVDLSVYNVNGQLVSRLVNEVRVLGFHEVQWDASALASGTYFVRLTTTAFTRTQRVILLK